MSAADATLNNRYRLDKSIGEGGFASVFLATDLELRRQVAVKVLAQSWLQDAELVTRFRNEARVIAALDHPNILQIYDFGVAGGIPYLVMPYVSGGTLADRLKQGPCTLDEIGFYLDQIGSALDYAHGRGVVHRDVKPTNLLIRPNGQLVLMDFGLAKLLDNVALEARTAVVGTVAYMAPEQCQGLVSAASDIYMLGVLFYQLLTGTLPYAGDTSQVLHGHLHSSPRSLEGCPTRRSVHPAVIRALNQVILKVLAKVPAHRYPTCQAFTFAYYQALKADPGRARPYGHETSLERGNPDETVIDPEPPKPQKIVLKPARLIITTEPDKGFRAVFDLTSETLTLGRAPDNTLCLPLSIVSRRHAVFNRLHNEFREPSYKIVPCKSVNPLYFQGQIVAEKVLEDGDMFEIGRRGYAAYIVKLLYQAPEYGFK
jgi:serine/threonine protein kinase